MLFDLEPSVKVKGNAFYTQDGVFDSEFVAVLNKQCEAFIMHQVKQTLISDNFGESLGTSGLNFVSCVLHLV